MRTDVMIKQLRNVAKKHENVKLHTFDTNISLMCTEVANRLEELEKENKEIRAKAIDEFAKELKKHKFHSKERYENCVPVCQIDWIAKQMKGGRKNE